MPEFTRGDGMRLAVQAVMSHRKVETVIGRLVTDEGFRRGFFTDPAATLEDLRDRGCELTAVEIEALVAIDLDAIQSFARGIDLRLQKL
jgi:hypothetical protein